MALSARFISSFDGTITKVQTFHIPGRTGDILLKVTERFTGLTEVKVANNKAGSIRRILCSLCTVSPVTLVAASEWFPSHRRVSVKSQRFQIGLKILLLEPRLRHGNQAGNSCTPIWTLHSPADCQPCCGGTVRWQGWLRWRGILRWPCFLSLWRTPARLPLLPNSCPPKMHHAGWSPQGKQTWTHNSRAHVPKKQKKLVALLYLCYTNRWPHLVGFPEVSSHIVQTTRQNNSKTSKNDF